MLAAANLAANYDPREHGARCDECDILLEAVRAALGGLPPARAPVPPSIPPGAKLLIVGEAPGKVEEEKGEPFRGPSGIELVRALTALGFSRRDVGLTNVILCRPPGRSLSEYVYKLHKRNAAAKRKDLKPPGHPIECCRPRLEREVAVAPALLLLGATATQAVLGGHAGEQGLRRLRGFPQVPTTGPAHSKPVVATVHPAFVLRSRRWTETFRSDVGKAFRHATGRLQWTAPDVLLDPSVDTLDAALDRLGRAGAPVAIDTETDGLDPETVNLRCVGLGSRDFAVVVPFRSIESPPRVFRIDRVRAAERIRNFLASGRAPIVGQNVIGYDLRVLERHGMPLPADVIDTLVLDHVGESEMPHDLEFLASRHLDCPGWKRKHNEWTADLDLHKYCGFDCTNDAALTPMLARRVTESGQRAVYESDMALQHLCVNMHRAGMAIDQRERSRHADRLRCKMADAKARASAASGEPDLNLASPDQVREFLYDGLGLVPPGFETGSGEPSTNKDAIYEIMQRALPDNVLAFLDALLDFRSAFRSLTKDVQGLSPDGRGRVHPFWSGAHVVTGRVSCSDPNVGNVPSTKIDPDSLRSMYVAEPGNVLVAADLEQAELRVIAVLSGDEPWLDAFARGLDVHKANAEAFFGIKYDDVEPFHRIFAKNAVFLFCYGGLAKKALMLMRKVMNAETKERPYARLKLREAEVMRDRFLRLHPALPRWWDTTIAEFRRSRALRSPILGRVRRFLDVAQGTGDEEQANEIRNFQVQSLVADIVSGAGACGALAESIGWPWSPSGGRGLGGPGIVHDGYDAMMAEARADRADEAKRALEEAMTTTFTVDGRSIVIPAKAKVGTRWSALA